MMKMAIDTEDWEEEMNTAQIVKPYMDRIVLDYLVTEGKLEAAHIFMEESLIRVMIQHFFLSFLSVSILTLLCYQLKYSLWMSELPNELLLWKPSRLEISILLKRS